MNMPTKLINFHVPTNVKMRFDEYCRILSTSRSKVLNDMIEDFLIQNESLVAERIAKMSQLNELHNDTSTIMRFREFIRSQSQGQDDDGPPRFFISEHE